MTSVRSYRDALARNGRFRDAGSMAARQEYSIGGVSLIALSDGYIVMDHDFVGSPEHPTAAWDANMNVDGDLVMPIGCFLVPGEKNVLIDLGYGPHNENGAGRMVGGNLLGALESLGMAPHDVDVIALSHLHPDHVGWLGNEHGQAVFPNAEVIVGSQDWDYFVESDPAYSAGPALPLEPHIRETLIVLAERGRVELLDSDASITPYVTRIAAPGHTPGHSVFAVHDGGARAVLFGDAMYCAEQLTNTDWGAMTDVDHALAETTRERLARDLDAHGGVGLGCHFPGLLAGRLVISTGE